MRRVGVPVAIAVAGLVWSGAEVAADQLPPAITNLKATPSRFCAKSSTRCRHPGTRITFTVSTAARVRGDIRPREVYRAPLIEFEKHFPAGNNAIFLNDSRLTPGRWTLRLQGRNQTAAGGVTLVDVRVVKNG